ncbi:MAG TPA: GNAT family N-acetyltransferase [Roseiflexaceae bacterium]|nr:GNAT family N-acetyltransferase [Roseiflexaceae bacterium]
MDTAAAWEIAIAGFAGTALGRRVARRFRAGPLEAVRFAQGEISGKPFNEFFAHACDPAEALAAIAAARPLERHYLTVLAHRPGLREPYERGGYRLDDTETLMVCDLATLPALVPVRDVALVGMDEDAAWYNANDPEARTWILPENLADPRMAHYAVVEGGQLLARGRTLRLDAHHSYVSRVYTAEARRGQGLARALMARLLADDIAKGVRWSVLTASRTGAPLYTRLGYHPLGTVLLFLPAQG